MSSDPAFEVPPQGAAADWTLSQGWETYSADDHKIWLTLYDRQMKRLSNRACAGFLSGLQKLDLRGSGIPDFHDLNKRLQPLTGWRVVATPGLVPDSVFFEHLANRRFPAGRFIRRAQELDYLEEPDVFHDVFGHVPMLTDPVFADYMQAYGEGGLRALALGRLSNLARLYWYTVEFGLLQTAEGLRIYGAGILSSYAEAVFSLEDPSPNRLSFELERVLRTPYRIDDYQQLYFVVPSLEALRDATLRDFGPIYRRLEAHGDLALDAIDPDDVILHHGSQRHWRGGTPHPVKNLA